MAAITLDFPMNFPKFAANWMKLHLLVRLPGYHGTAQSHHGVNLMAESLCLQEALVQLV